MVGIGRRYGLANRYLILQMCGFESRHPHQNLVMRFRKWRVAVGKFEDSSMIPISKKDVDKALDEIDRDGVPARRRSTGYCLEARGHHYPPKYVLSRTYHLKTGKGHPPLHGGERLNAYLRPFYPVVSDNCRNPDLKIVR